MKKILFNDKFGLTQAVLDGRKTQTRRIVPKSTIDKYSLMADFTIIDDARYNVGEVVAVAQSYNDCGYGECAPIVSLDENGIATFGSDAGSYNKMFVRADLMPHRIRITDVRVERLQDISYEDCLAEGAYIHDEDPMNPQAYLYSFPNSPNVYYHPREAYAALIDKISGKGVWSSNPYVFAYTFELVK